MRGPARNRKAKDTVFKRLTHGGIPFNVCAPARLGRLEAILMPYLHFLLQYFIQSHFYGFPALVMSLELLHISMAVHTHALFERSCDLRSAAENSIAEKFAVGGVV